MLVERSADPACPPVIGFKLLTDLIESRFGLVFADGRGDQLRSRLSTRIDSLNLDGFRDYYHYLSHHPGRKNELTEVAIEITNGESYFFREHHHFDILRNHVLPERLENDPETPLRILSAGCSAGQEAYSIAITFQKAGKSLDLPGWEVDGCDIHHDRLAQARDGRYGLSSLRACPDVIRKDYFEMEDGIFTIKNRFQNQVRFFETNLVGSCASTLRKYDAIFCRNVLIYFSETAFHIAIDSLSRALAPGGYLFLGHAESLINRRNDFEPVCLNGKIVYRKKETGRSSAYS